jgi:hypothetical protein
LNYRVICQNLGFANRDYRAGDAVSGEQLKDADIDRLIDIGAIEPLQSEAAEQKAPATEPEKPTKKKGK